MHSERRSILHRLTQRVQPFGAEALIIELPRTGVNIQSRIRPCDYPLKNQVASLPWPILACFSIGLIA
jgi:hypothetical protein